MAHIDSKIKAKVKTPSLGRVQALLNREIGKVEQLRLEAVQERARHAEREQELIKEIDLLKAKLGEERVYRAEWQRKAETLAKANDDMREELRVTKLSEAGLNGQIAAFERLGAIPPLKLNRPSAPPPYPGATFDPVAGLWR